MDAASTSNVGTTKTDSNALKLINKRIQVLRKEHNLILQKVKSLSKKRRKVLRSKYRVMGQIDELEKLSKEISSSHGCKGHLPFNSQLVNVNVSPSDADMEGSDETDSAACIAKRRRKDVEAVATKPSENERYLCVSNGITIFCLDLKQSKYQSFSSADDVPPPPKIASIILLEEHRPVSVGLFKLGSDAYVIGGGKVPPLLAENPNPSWGEDHTNSSCVIHNLSLVNSTLSLSKSNIGKLKKPKLWPLVEKIDGQIHVFDTVPCDLFADVPDWIFSHEVLTLDGRWIKVPTIMARDNCHMTDHLVVGDRIFTVANGVSLVFDSKMKNWVAHSVCACQDPFSVKQVWQILHLGYARCAGEFPCGEPNAPLYVLIAVGMEGPTDNMLALAYLVTATGQVLCFQCLPHFFNGPLQPCDLLKGTMINVDEEGKTMCALLSSVTWAHPPDRCREYLFIYTFTVEILTDHAMKVHQQIRENANEDCPFEQEFVRVALKDKYVFKADLEGEYDDMIRLLAVQACFL